MIARMLSVTLREARRGAAQYGDRDSARDLTKLSSTGAPNAIFEVNATYEEEAAAIASGLSRASPV